jgi:hypothetical protein
VRLSLPINIGVVKIFGEKGMACTLGLVGVALLGLKSVWNESVGEVSRKADVDAECKEVTDWSFSTLPIELFALEEEYRVLFGSQPSLNEVVEAERQEKLEELKEEVLALRDQYQLALSEIVGAQIQKQLIE